MHYETASRDSITKIWGPTTVAPFMPHGEGEVVLRLPVQLYSSILKQPPLLLPLLTLHCFAAIAKRKH